MPNSAFDALIDPGSRRNVDASVEKKDQFIWLSPRTTNEHGGEVQYVYRTSTDPTAMSAAERTQLEPIATVFYHSEEEMRAHPKIGRSMTHIPGAMSREERNDLMKSIGELLPDYKA